MISWLERGVKSWRQISTCLFFTTSQLRRSEGNVQWASLLAKEKGKTRGETSETHWLPDSPPRQAVTCRRYKVVSRHRNCPCRSWRDWLKGCLERQLLSCDRLGLPATTIIHYSSKWRVVEWDFFFYLSSFGRGPENQNLQIVENGKSGNLDLLENRCKHSFQLRIKCSSVPIVTSL